MQRARWGLGKDWKVMFPFDRKCSTDQQPQTEIPLHRCRKDWRLEKDYLDCVACCTKATDVVNNAVETTVVIGNIRKMKGWSLSKISTQNIWVKQYNKIGSAIGKRVPGLTPKTGRTLIRRGVVALILIDGAIAWGCISYCTCACTK